jgi:hypothetical protein
VREEVNVLGTWLAAHDELMSSLREVIMNDDIDKLDELSQDPDNAALKAERPSGAAGEPSKLAQAGRLLSEHPLGTTAGAAGGAAAGAVSGLAFGPVGSLFGALAGAVLGGMTGGATPTTQAGAPADPGSASTPQEVLADPDRDAAADDYAPAHRLGSEACNLVVETRTWADVEPELGRVWERLRSEGRLQTELEWPEARAAARRAWGDD